MEPEADLGDAAVLLTPTYARKLPVHDGWGEAASADWAYASLTAENA